MVEEAGRRKRGPKSMLCNGLQFTITIVNAGMHTAAKQSVYHPVIYDYLLLVIWKVSFCCKSP